MTSEVTTSVHGSVATIEFSRPPANFFSRDLLADLADALHDCDGIPAIRAVVLCSAGKHFCPGAELRDIDEDGLRAFYREALRIFTSRKPIVAAIQGSTAGGGLGLALAADFRVVAHSARLTANFARLGFHQGFGLTVTLPRLVGSQAAQDLLYTGRGVSGEEAAAMGLCDRLVDGDPRQAASDLAASIAESAPLSLIAIRASLRRGLVGDVARALDLEAAAQGALLGTADFAEGVQAAVDRRDPVFEAR
jgi:enoyl-CoA hydratase/carnithine racemase